MKKTITDVNVENKRVFVRADFNVPLDENCNITDDTRIQKTLPTIKYLLDHKAAVILASHLGRPKGQVVEKYSLKPVAKRLSELLGIDVKFAPDCVGAETKAMADALKPGEVLLLENLRFHKEEEKNGEDFARQLASLAEVGINDAFGCCHRAHASVAGITKFLPMAAGFLLEKEIRFIGGAVDNPAHPFAAIIGGAKVSDKIEVISNLLPKVDLMIIGGGMANTFLAAQGYGIGKSLVEADKIDLAKQLINQAKEQGTKLLLPVDVMVAAEFKNDADHKVVPVDAVPADWMILDVGTKTQELFAKELAPMKLIVWNGPMGVFEMENYAKGTEAVAKAVADSDAVSIVGGGDSVSAVNKTGLADKISHISTGGGASLEYLEGKQLPGVVSLSDKRKTIIAGNWKMNHLAADANETIQGLVAKVPQDVKPEVIIAPVFPYLPMAVEMTKGTPIHVAAQNMHWEEKGAFTGEVSPAMLVDIGVTHVIIGHSERRTYFNETDETVNKKAKAALAHNLTPIICCGETLEQREQGIMQSWIEGQIEKALAGLSAADVKKVVIAYEPIWAIGTGKTASAAQAEEVCAIIRKKIAALYDEATAEVVSILYGGSVKGGNVAELTGSADIDGGLVGGASLKADDFLAIINNAVVK
ncbi:MAG: triose-phosphate isomerase [Megasphaera elsdenii]|nr:triose-phosphate isomerase [Megasphaera elsdenii]